MNNSSFWRIALPILSVSSFLLFWSWYVHTSDVSAFVLPAPETILKALSEMIFDPKLWHHAKITLTEAVSGFVIAVSLGISLGFIMARVPAVEWAMKPFIVLLQLVPKIALAPLFILWFGFGLESKIVIAAALAFFPVFSNALVAFKSVDNGDRDVMTMLQATPLQRLILLDLPTALPVVLTGMEVSVVMAMIGAIVGEFIGGSEGLGYLAVAYLQELAVPELFGVIVVLTLMGLLLYTLIGRLRAWFAPWHASAEKA
ncbi:MULTISPECIES: ABC transporter permease [Pacificibacter]|uniref:ABC transporter permease n=1 Tax=Pacificibacter TaxID=1042323 RepID=UPI001C081942|nr:MULTISPECIES: ABC transporter permease [Pacificibacter]MBU2935209.1 ABC transporter permease [Pacificibacter marinus]MDO6616001.1 ABC transporter permease [Pacificibacter sp. 1_MG-2023]